MPHQLQCRLAKCVIFNFFSYCKAIVSFLSHLCSCTVIVRNELCLCFVFVLCLYPLAYTTNQKKRMPCKIIRVT